MKLIAWYAILLGILTAAAAAFFAVFALVNGPDLVRCLLGFAASGLGCLVYTAGEWLNTENHRREGINRIRKVQADRT